MRLLSGLMAAVLLSLAGTGCSHGTLKEVPTAPTATTTVTIASLTVTPVGGGSMIEGMTTPITSSGGFPSTGATLGAFAQYTDGSGKYVPATWTSSDVNVIAIEGDTMIAKARGTVTITASAEGKTDTETFVVHGGIPGTWSGTLLIEQCDAGSGSMYEVICQPPTQGRQPGALGIGTKPAFTLVITRSGDELRAIVQVGSARGSLTGSEQGQNFFTLAGEMTVDRTSAKIVHWNSRVQQDLMEGLVGFEVRIAGLPSHANVVGRMDAVTRR